jgi:hypothetical protein
MRFVRSGAAQELAAGNTTHYINNPREHIMESVSGRVALSLIMLAALTGTSHAAGTRVTNFSGRLWLVSNQGGNLPASPPVPSATPDATFTTAHVAFYMQSPSSFGNGPNINNSVGGFLNSANKVGRLTFSGLKNPIVNGVVSATTPVTNSTASSLGTYGVYLDLIGQVSLVNGQSIYLPHDDGLTVQIDGATIAGITASGGARMDSLTFTGPTGVHKVEIFYVNLFGGGLLDFTSNM